MWSLSLANVDEFGYSTELLILNFDYVEKLQYSLFILTNYIYYIINYLTQMSLKCSHRELKVD